MPESEANTDGLSGRPEYVTLDQEAWVIDRLHTLVEASNAIEDIRRRGVGADNRPLNYAVNGLVHGTAAELFNTLDLECEGVNIDLSAADTWLIHDDVEDD